MKRDDDPLDDDGEIVPFVPGIRNGSVCARCGCALGLCNFSIVFADLCPDCAAGHWDDLLGYPPDVSEVSDVVM